MTKSLAHQFAEYTWALRFEDLSRETVNEVKRRVIDSIGCALGAWNEEPCRIAREVASEFSAKYGATIIGTHHQAPPDWAAFATGCCIRYFDYNDTYLSKEPAHPSDNISAALAVAESVGASGRDAITAIALAYEVQCRLCDAASIRARGWDHVTYGAFSTALASAKLMKLDREKTRHAVNIAGVACAAMRQARVGELSHWKGVAFANVSQVASVNIESHDASVDIIGSEPEKWRPETRETADHSLPYITAIALIDGKVTGEQFQPSRFTDPAIWKFLENVKVTRNAELSSLYPGAVANIVHLTLKDGRTLSKRVDYPLGHAKNPLSDVELERKFLHLVAPALGRDHSAKILQQAWLLDQEKDVHHLMRLLRMP